jgi:hypothetical protein
MLALQWIGAFGDETATIDTFLLREEFLRPAIANGGKDPILTPLPRLTTDTPSQSR